MMRRTPSGNAKNGITSSVAAPALRDRRILYAPRSLCEGVKGGLAGGRICGAIERRKPRDALAILPGSKIHRMADQVNDAGLLDTLRKNCINGLWKALQAIHDGDQNVLGAAGLEFVDDAQPEFGALGLFDPDTENLLNAVPQHAERDVDCLVRTKPSSRILTRMASKYANR